MAAARDHRGQRDDYHREILRMRRAPRNYAGSFGIEFRSRRTRPRIFRILRYLESIPIYPNRALPTEKRRSRRRVYETREGKERATILLSFLLLSYLLSYLFDRIGDPIRIYIYPRFRRLHNLRPIYIYIVVGYTGRIVNSRDN